MIPSAYITEWQQSAPWQQPEMIEQDLIICRALIELFSDGYIADHFAFRGGTALYKLCLSHPARYSEDIDLVQVYAESIGPALDRVRTILDPWLGKSRYDAKNQSFRLTTHKAGRSYLPGAAVTSSYGIRCIYSGGSVVR